MPVYIFKCKKGHEEEYWLRMGAKPDKCEVCGSKSLTQIFTVPNGTVEQEPRTIGQQMDKNAKLFGREECQERELKAAEAYEEGLIKSGKKKKGPKKLPWWRDGSIPGTVRSEKPISQEVAKKYRKNLEDMQGGRPLKTDGI